MEKLAQVRQFVENLNMVDANQIEVWPEDTSYRVVGKPKGQALVMLQCDYTIILDIQGWPHDRIPVGVLVANIAGLVVDMGDLEDSSGNNRDITASFDVLDDGKANVEIPLEVSEALEVTEHADGNIAAFGKTWRLTATPMNRK